MPPRDPLIYETKTTKELDMKGKRNALDSTIKLQITK
jgi:hypothetical protein